METPVSLQYIEIGEIRHSRQTNHRHIDLPCHSSRSFYLQSDRIFFFDMNIFIIRDHTDHRNSGKLPDDLPSFFKKRHIAAKLIDNDTFDQISLLFRQQHHGTINRSKHSSPIDIRHQVSRSIHLFRHPHVRNIPVPQIKLGDTTGPLQYNRIIVFFQTMKCLHGLGK